MADLITDPNLPDPDGFYAELIRSFEAQGDDAAIRAFSVRLILLLANHVGDRAVLSRALAEAARNPAHARG